MYPCTDLNSIFCGTLSSFPSTSLPRRSSANLSWEYPLLFSGCSVRYGLSFPLRLFYSDTALGSLAEPGIQPRVPWPLLLCTGVVPRFAVLLWRQRLDTGHHCRRWGRERYPQQDRYQAINVPFVSYRTLVCGIANSHRPAWLALYLVKALKLAR